jgi:hypothetical protein
MLAERLRKLAHEWAERTAVEQGLSPKVMDVAVLRRVVQLLGLAKIPSGSRERTLAQASAYASSAILRS